MYRIEPFNSSASGRVRGGVMKRVRRRVVLRLPHARGFTLLEMLIAITVGLGILAGLVGVLASNSSNAKTNDRTSELMTNGRFALNSMKAELREAGFRGYTYAEPGPANPWVSLGAADSFCAALDAGASATPDDFVGNIRQAVWGGNNVNPFQDNCLKDLSGSGPVYMEDTDVLVIRRLDSFPETGSLDNGTVYFRSTYERGQMFRGAAGSLPGGFTGAAPLATFKVHVYVYYIRPYTDSADESPRIPSLRRKFLDTGGAMRDELVVSGIERMQVQYGLRTDINATESETVYTSEPFGEDWDKVNSVRLWLLARNTSPESGYHNTETYAMGDQEATVNDGIRRQLFSAVVQLRN